MPTGKTGISQTIGTKWFLPRDALHDLVRVLIDLGYTVIGPTVQDDVVMLKPITRAEQIARGVVDEQDGGHYRLHPAEGEVYFDYVVGQDSAKRYFFPPTQKLFTLHVEGRQFVVDTFQHQPPKLAMLGLRPCDVAAIAVQDRVFVYGDGAFRCESETYYNEARRNSMIIAVNCTRPGGTCFCVSMETGPRATCGFDLALTELCNGFVVTLGSEKGVALADRLPLREPTSAELELEDLKLQRAEEHMGRMLNTNNIVELLDFKIDHAHYNEVAERCLGCGNCTMVCPTCFCSTVTDSTDLTHGAATRTRQWESCFTHQFSYTVGGSVRTGSRARYCHWLRHKLGTWHAQFGTSGCVGCGRCITWCPVGIDITEEAALIRGDWTPAQHEASS